MDAAQELGEEVVGEQALADLRRLFNAWARLLGNYKPVLGAAFHEFIGTHTRLMLHHTHTQVLTNHGTHPEGYSHWAWGDIDTLVGDVGRLIKAEDLRQFDVITFNRGNGLLYLFGQFTILANRPELLEAWKVFLHPPTHTHTLVMAHD